MGRQASSFTESAHTVRAILFAMATATALNVFSSTILRSQGSLIFSCLPWWRSTETAPRTGRLLMPRRAVSVILPSRSRPPVECWRGVSPVQAEKSLPLRKLSIGGANAWTAIAHTGPTPGTVTRFLISSRSREQRLISRSSSAGRHQAGLRRLAAQRG